MPSAANRLRRHNKQRPIILIIDSIGHSSSSSSSPCPDVTSVRLSSREFSAVHTASKPSRRRLAFRPITQTRSQPSVFMMRGLLLCRETERRPVIASPANHENSAHAHSSLSRCYHICITLDHTALQRTMPAFLQVVHYAAYSLKT